MNDISTAPPPLDFFSFETHQPPILLGLYRVIDQLLIAQRETEKQLLGTCWAGEGATKGFTARLLAGFDLSVCAPDIATILETWKHCPITDSERRATWLWAVLFAKNLHLVAVKYSGDYLPESEGHLLPKRIQRLHAGRLALEELEDGWLDDPMHLVQAGQTPILTLSPSLAAGVTQRGYVGIPVYNRDPDFLIGELLAARPDLVAVTDDVPDAPQLVADCRALGLKAILWSEKK